MKVTSTCERRFVENCIIKKQKRLDGRQLSESRTLEIVFGKERGCCFVIQGNTRTVSQVSCEVTEPKPSTPTEGALHINLEMSAMAAPDVKSQSRSSEETVEAQRAIERCVRDSKCIDLESLCIVTGSKVWTIRVDIHTLNDDGNIIECGSIAAVSALAHFRRPDVTVVGTDVTIHSLDEKEPVPLNLHHMPISICLALFDQGKYILVDPTEIEERIADGCYLIGMNAHQEICFVHRRGILLLTEDSIQRCEDIAVKHAQEVTQIIRKALDDDAYKRATNAQIGFTNLIQTDTILGGKRPIAEINFDSIRDEPVTVDIDAAEGENMVVDISDDEAKTYTYKKSAATRRAMKILQEPETSIFQGGTSKWGIEEQEDDEEESSSTKEPETKSSISVKEETGEESEEEAVYVNEDQVDVKPNTRGWYSKDPFM